MTEGYRALGEGAALLKLDGRGVIVARGRDRARLLHNLTTNNVKALAPGQGCYAFLLNPQGRIQSDVSLYCFAEHFLLEMESALRETVPGLIRRYIISDQVELEDVSEGTAVIAVEGPLSGEVAARAGAPVPREAYAHEQWDEATIAAASVTGATGYRIFCGVSALDGLIGRLKAAGASEASAADARVARIENFQPRFPDDFRDTTLVQETGQMHAVSFNKGCYLGQEIVERVRARGHVNRKLVRLTIESDVVPAPAAPLLAEGAEAGEITSAALSPRTGQVVALAYVKAPHLERSEFTVAGAAAHVY